MSLLYGRLAEDNMAWLPGPFFDIINILFKIKLLTIFRIISSVIFSTLNLSMAFWNSTRGSSSFFFSPVIPKKSEKRSYAGKAMRKIVLYEANFGVLGTKKS
jgi:hypothetical protein